METPTVLTEVFVDENYIITGSITGLVTVRSLTTGAKLKELNTVKETQVSDFLGF